MTLQYDTSINVNYKPFTERFQRLTKLNAADGLVTLTLHLTYDAEDKDKDNEEEDHVIVTLQAQK